MPAPEPVTFFIIYDDGSIEQQDVEGVDSPEPTLSKPGRVAGQIEYEQYRLRLEEQNKIWIAETDARQQAVQKVDYDGLILAGIPDATARRLTGYTGP